MSTTEAPYSKSLKNSSAHLQIASSSSPLISIGGEALDEVGNCYFKPPLVSFVLINRNYGRYIGQTIDSIRAQDYPCFECLVIDNGSTDDSRAVIARHVKSDPRFTVEHLPDNLGQLGAAFWALDRIRGGFVTFVDADDVLFPSFASIHLQVHLALPQSVALTSSNVIEIDADGAMLTSAYQPFSSSANSEEAAKGLKSGTNLARVLAVSDETYAQLAQQTSALPASMNGWLWAPGTSNMFRRSILSLGKIDGEEQKHFRSIDGHFNRLCHALGGTALIDLPLSGYRYHGANFFSTRETIPGLRRGTPAYDAKIKTDRRHTIEVLLDRAELFGWLLSRRYWNTIDQLTAVKKSKLDAYYIHSDSEAMFARHIDKLRAAFGEKRVAYEISARFRRNATLRILGGGSRAAIPLLFRLRLRRLQLARFFRRGKRRRHEAK